MEDKNANQSNKVVNAGIGYTIGNILIKGISFLTIPLYTHLMGTADYGIYNTYVAYTGIVTFLVCLGLDPTLKNAKQDFSEHRETYLSTVYILTLIATAVFLALILVFRNQLETFINLDKLILILIVFNAEAAAVLNIYNIKLSLDYSSKRYIIIAFLQTAFGILGSVTLMLTVFQGNRYMGRIIGTMIPTVCIATVILFRSIVKPEASPKFEGRMARYSLRIGLPLVPHLLAQIVNAQFDRIMISKLVGFAESGIYSFTYNIAVILQIVYQSLDNVWSPWFFEKMARMEYGEIKRYSKKYTALITFFAVSLMTISNEFIMIFAEETYWTGKSLTFTLIVGIFFLFLYTLPVGVEYYTKNTKFIAFGSILTAGLNVVLNYYGIKHLGYETAAYTTMISYIVLFALHWSIAGRLFEIKKIFDFKWMIGAAVVVMVWGVFCRFTQNLWIVRYGGYLIVLIFAFFYFKENIQTYLQNAKNKRECRMKE